jgi:hypothetical protein
MSTKEFRIWYNVGKAKYLVSFHNGENFHNDGSKFFDAKIFKNKQKMFAFTKELLKQGYLSTN